MSWESTWKEEVFSIQLEIPINMSRQVQSEKEDGFMIEERPTAMLEFEMVLPCLKYHVLSRNLAKAAATPPLSSSSFLAISFLFSIANLCSSSAAAAIKTS